MRAIRRAPGPDTGFFDPVIPALAGVLRGAPSGVFTAGSNHFRQTMARLLLGSRVRRRGPQGYTRFGGQ
jgi:hypothetical protein